MEKAYLAIEPLNLALCTAARPSIPPMTMNILTSEAALGTRAALTFETARQVVCVFHGAFHVSAARDGFEERSKTWRLLSAVESTR